MAIARPSRAIHYDALDESELVALAKAGHRDAFRAIMTRCNQRLFRVARGVVRDEAEAEDVLQEAYTRAFAKLATFRGESSLLTWLTRITINEARGRLRKRRHTVGLDELEAAQQEGALVIMFPSANGDGPEADAGRAQLRRLIERAVDDLPEPFRVVFILRDVDECSIEETAAALGIRPETVKTRLFRARRMLRRALDERLSSTMAEAFPFLGARCERITQSVLARMAPSYGWEE